MNMKRSMGKMLNLLLVICLLALSACGAALPKNEVAGIFEGSDATYYFARDGSMRVIQDKTVGVGTYTAADGKITMDWCSWLYIEPASNEEFEYILDGDTLTIFYYGSSGDIYTNIGEAPDSVALELSKANSITGSYSDLQPLPSIYTFYENGDCTVPLPFFGGETPGTYSINDGILMINRSGTVDRYAFELTDDRLILFAPDSGDSGRNMGYIYERIE